MFVINQSPSRLMDQKEQSPSSSSGTYFYLACWNPYWIHTSTPRSQNRLTVVRSDRDLPDLESASAKLQAFASNPSSSDGNKSLRVTLDKQPLRIITFILV